MLHVYLDRCKLYIVRIYQFSSYSSHTRSIAVSLTDSSVMSPYRTGGGGLPPKNGPLTSSIGSVATLTTVADEQADPEECGRVAGWVANFDKLLQDPLGVKCLLVSQS